MKIKKELFLKEIKKELNKEEAEAVAVAFAGVLDYVTITHGATILEKLKAKRTKTAEALGDLFGFPYISNSINNEAGALWNTNTSAELVGLDGFEFLGLAVGVNGEFVGIFQEHNEKGEEVGAVRFLVLSYLPEFIAKEQRARHEAERVASLENIQQFRKTAREILPKACAVLEKYRGKRWGETTRGKIWEELRELNTNGVSVSASWGRYFVDLEIVKSRNSAGLSVSFSWKFDSQNNTPAEEITPSAQHLAMLAEFSIKEHRRKVRGIIEEIEKTAEKLGQLIEAYNEEARDKGYRKAGNISKWGLNLADLTRKDLDR